MALLSSPHTNLSIIYYAILSTVIPIVVLNCTLTMVDMVLVVTT